MQDYANVVIVAAGYDLCTCLYNSKLGLFTLTWTVLGLDYS